MKSRFIKTTSAGLIRGLQLAALVSVVAGVALPAWSQAYPAKAVRMIVAFPPGGITDTVGRVIADKMSKQMGQPFVIDNRPGAGGMIGLEALIKFRFPTCTPPTWPSAAATCAPPTSPAAVTAG